MLKIVLTPKILRPPAIGGLGLSLFSLMVNPSRNVDYFISLTVVNPRMRLDYQISLKSSPLNLLAGSTPAAVYIMLWKETEKRHCSLTIVCETCQFYCTTEDFSILTELQSPVTYKVQNEQETCKVQMNMNRNSVARMRWSVESGNLHV